MQLTAYRCLSELSMSAAIAFVSWVAYAYAHAMLVDLYLHRVLPEAWCIFMCMCDEQVWDSFWSGYIPGTGCQGPRSAPHHH